MLVFLIIWFLSGFIAIILKIWYQKDTTEFTLKDLVYCIPIGILGFISVWVILTSIEGTDKIVLFKKKNK